MEESFGKLEIFSLLNKNNIINKAFVTISNLHPLIVMKAFNSFRVRDLLTYMIIYVRTGNISTTGMMYMTPLPAATSAPQTFRSYIGLVAKNLTDVVSVIVEIYSNLILTENKSFNSFIVFNRDLYLKLYCSKTKSFKSLKATDKT